ncbi:unnamed protein product [Rotaria sordida]|uniref:Uncharacterized protein n=1 Tax=Rotaria sordida TaxID=392033 RepID=A0A815E2P6_9BILA|nr:unnamed protein product [Rotaria sordida]CAF0847041.1 unnamed protein product [Rotaria sordida]CAF0883943.1 unnamed protein product [Rotaria sordida]CAF1233020.1 unnamed protein product [Rotaria sordida]CAF1305872.1 unnamed protein product [Rotaria sordida]
MVKFEIFNYLKYYFSNVGNQPPFYSHQPSLFTPTNDELVPLARQSQSFDPYQSSVEYRLQELAKRLSTLETKLTEDVSTVLSILRRQFPTNNLSISLSSNDIFKTNS